LGGGGGVFTAHLAQELAKRHKVTVLTSQGLGAPADSIEGGVRVVRVPVFLRKQQATASLVSMVSFILKGTREGKKLLKSQSFDIINTHFALPTGPVGDALARFGGIPNVLLVIGGDIYDPSKFTSPHRHILLKTWVKRLLRRADLVVGESSDILERTRQYYAPEIEGVLLPYGIQRPEFTPAARAEFGFAEDDILLVTVGRLVGRKAVHQLIAMVESLEDRRVRLVVIGSGPLEQSLKEECQKRGVADRVRFTGFVSEEEKFQLLEMSDIYVSTSQHEGFGLVFLEAMHCGLPIVCYDQGGQTDFLRDEETGYLVPLNNLEQFGERCRWLIEDAGLRRAMGQTNRRRIEDFYIENCARRYEDVFQKAIKRFNDGISRKTSTDWLHLLVLPCALTPVL
jgi:glycosyltransferase involved in cell wall biosynthesis